MGAMPRSSAHHLGLHEVRSFLRQAEAAVARFRDATDDDEADPVRLLEGSIRDCCDHCDRLLRQHDEAVTAPLFQAMEAIDRDLRNEAARAGHSTAITHRCN
jgi:hypothetical protein